MTDRSHRKAPLSRHPLFPAIVAGWFGALMGIGGLAVRTTVLENMVLALRIDRLVPAAVPPLGLTARVLLTLALMVAGAMFGYALAKLLARAARVRNDEPASAPGIVVAPSAEAQPRSEPDAGTEDDDDLARLAAARALPQRRRALTLEELPEPAPLALAERTGPSILNVGDLNAISPIIDNAAPQPGVHAGAVSREQVPPALKPSGTTDDGLRPPPLSSLGIAQLVERFALALASAQVRQPHAPADHAAQPSLQVDAPEPPAPEHFIDDSQHYQQAQAAAGGRDFAMPSALSGAGAVPSEWLDEAEEEATLESLLPPKQPVTNDPFKTAIAALSRQTADEDARWTVPEIDESTAEQDDFEEAGTEEPDEAAADDDAPFSSLLDMKPSSRQPAPLDSLVRIEADVAVDVAEPIVVFPGQSVPPQAVPARLPGAPFGASPVATETALREALSALQRMSGTR